jgi:hypothetical protein
MTTRSEITKRKLSILKNDLPIQQVKLEEDTDTKALLQSPSKSLKLKKGRRITQEQINQLIHYIVNDGMGICKAVRKLNIHQTTASDYYKLYINDPETKISVPRNPIGRTFTQEQIGNPIGYIDTDKMTVKKASAKANMSCDSGYKYYNKYLKDPNHNIPTPPIYKTHTQDEGDELISYIANDKMTILAASEKAKINISTARRYYQKYLKKQNPGISTPSHIDRRPPCTQEQIKEVIGYINNNRLSIKDASVKANMAPCVAAMYYQ